MEGQNQGDRGVIERRVAVGGVTSGIEPVWGLYADIEDETHHPKHELEGVAHRPRLRRQIIPLASSVSLVALLAGLPLFRRLFVPMFGPLLPFNLLSCARAVRAKLQVLVVEGSLPGVYQSSVCLLNFLEAVLCLGVIHVPVWMVTLCEFPVRILDLLRLRSTRYLKQVVVRLLLWGVRRSCIGCEGCPEVACWQRPSYRQAVHSGQATPRKTGP
mmetsp:Transcript_60506/g.131091  ORF Transcript_60506/g.131091 Transcript_60506/m.131091 type:complete len:215 (-) Transcript_60506:78-722(-)